MRVLLSDENETGASRKAPPENKISSDEPRLSRAERRLVENGAMRLPASDELPTEFWEMDAPEICADKIVRAIRAERDEN